MFLGVDLSEFLVISNQSLSDLTNISNTEVEEPYEELVQTRENDNKNVTWTHANTLILINLYKELHKEVGTFKIRNIKKLWEVISQELNRKYNIVMTPANCENKWRVLVRNYKKFIDNNKQTGAGRRYFEYSHEMEDVLGKKKNIQPSILLSSTTISKPPTITEAEDTEVPLCSDNCNGNQETMKNEHKSKKRKLDGVRGKRIKNKNDVLEKIRDDKRERHLERMAFEKSKLEKLCNLEESKLQVEERRNLLLEENILQQKEIINLLGKILQARSSQFISTLL